LEYLNRLIQDSSTRNRIAQIIISDGYHTFLDSCMTVDWLIMLLLFNEWGNNTVGITKDPKEMDGVKV
jgi:hypothetical protein